MGCDIHFVLEYQPEGEGTAWVGVYSSDATPPMVTQLPGDEPTGDSFVATWRRMPAFKDRHYGFFAALAGVRGEGPAPVGLPADRSSLTQVLIDRWGADGHSHSWLPYREFCQRYSLVQALVFGDKGEMVGISGVTNHDEPPYEAYRMVFWFDN